MKTVEKYVKDHLLELYELHRALCLIPAPSNHEEKRAEFCKRWFDENCGEGAYVDDALNVVFPYCPSAAMKELAVIVAHTDTVFTLAYRCLIVMTENASFLPEQVMILQVLR